MTRTVISQHRSGTLLREERLRQQLSMRELAHFAGVSHATVQRIENGSLDASAQIKARLARVLRTPVGELWPLEDNDLAGNEVEVTAHHAGVGGEDVL